jgi:amidohydrolase
MKNEIAAKAQAYFEDVRKVRHHIHSNPELSFHEFKTAEFVEAKLREWGITNISRLANTGVVALIEGKNPEKCCIALRADMDALPILEENDVPYKSQSNGVMHACGHDVHTSCLLGAARILNGLKDRFEGTIKLVFQPGEEKDPGGASLMIAAGVLENPKPSAIMAIHVYPNLPVGKIGVRGGQYMASSDEIYITIEGKGGHAAQPHAAIDPIAIAAQVITGLQQVVARKCNPINPSVLTFGAIHGGSATNIIPEKVEIMGTFRAMDEGWRREAHGWIKKITTDITEAYGGKATIRIPSGYPSLFNDPALSASVFEWAGKFVGTENVEHLEMRMGAEDFSFYTHHIPGCFFRVGTNQDGKLYTTSVHHPRFNIDEEAMKTGMGIMAWVGVNALAQAAGTTVED